MQADWIKTRQTKYTLYVTVYLGLIVAYVGVIKHLAEKAGAEAPPALQEKLA